MLIRIQISMLIRIGIKTMPIHMWILAQVLHMLENQNIFFTFTHRIARFSVKCATICSIFDILKFSGKKKFINFTIAWTWINPDQLNPDRHDLDADLDPAKWCGSDLIRIHNNGHTSAFFQVTKIILMKSRLLSAGSSQTWIFLRS